MKGKAKKANASKGSSSSSNQEGSESSSSRPRRNQKRASYIEVDPELEDEEEEVQVVPASRKKPRAKGPALDLPIPEPKTRKRRRSQKLQVRRDLYAAHEVDEAEIEDTFQNNSFERHPPNPTIDLMTGKAVPVPADWDARSNATRAANVGMQSRPDTKIYVGRLLGSLVLHAVRVTPQAVAYLAKPVEVAPHQIHTRNRVPRVVAWDEDGSFSTTSPHQISMSTLITLIGLHDVIPINKKYGALHWREGHAKALLLDMFCLQHPSSSPWESPLISCQTNHHYNPVTQVLEIQFFVYATRLLFEMIADEAIHTLMRNVEPISGVIPCSKTEPQPEMFTIQGEDELTQNPAYQFSLAGVLKRAENRGYAWDVDTPTGLRVQLFDYQKSTLQWLLDHERDPRGLNAYFWEAREWADGGAFYYFPLAGELRLQEPPFTTGGLLSEEMGLGKTVEILSLLLCNPFEGRNANTAAKMQPRAKKGAPELVETRATLIVVPPTLLSQWENEIHNRVEPGLLKVLKLSQSTLQVRVPDKLYNSEGVEITDEQWPLLRRGMDVGTYLPGGVPDRLYFGKLTFEKFRRQRDVDEVEYMKAQSSVYQIDYQLDDHDIVLTDYNTFKAKASMFRNFHWHRVVLDECQEIKVATNQLAAQCADISASHRWMVSGTPLCSKIEDLHGELNFLKVWPFSLQNDGFWEKKVGGPFYSRNASGLSLLYHLIDVVTIRHSKSQTYLDGSPLVRIPKRRIEYRAVDFGSVAEQYVYSFLEVFGRQALNTVFNRGPNAALADLDYIPANALLQPRDFVRLRALVFMAMKALISGDLIVLGALDTQRRMLLGAAIPMAPRVADDADAIQRMQPEDILRYVQSAGAGVLGMVTAGLNRDTDRVFALTNKKEEEARERLASLPIAALRRRLAEHDLPIPMTWITMPFVVSVVSGENTLVVHYDEVPADEEGGNSRKMAPDCVKPGDVLRLGKYSTEDSEVIVDDVTAESITLSHAWDSPNQEEVPLFRHAQSSRKQAYIDLLVARELNMADGSQLGGSQVHEGGFAALYRLIARQGVACPVCMSEAERPIVTPCVHIYCHACIGDILATASPRCPICRRALTRMQLMEADTSAFAEPMKDTTREELVDITNVDGDADYREDDNDERIDWRDVPGKGKRRRVATHESDSEASDYESDESDHTTESSATTAPTTTSPKINSDDTEFEIPELNIVESVSEDFLRTLPPPVRLVGRDQHYPSLDDVFLSHLAAFKAQLPSKVRTLFADIRESLEEDPTTKFVVFSQFPESLASIPTQWARHKAENDPELQFASLHGSQRDFNLNRFLNDPATNVCLIPMGSGASGLTLTVARICYFLEPAHNAAVEAQAVNRVHRISQTKNVRCVTFFSKNTVEERLLALRRARGMLTELLVNPDALSVQSELNPNLPRPKAGRQRRRRAAPAAPEPEPDTISKQGLFTAEGLHTLFIGAR